MPINSRRKGAYGERELAAFLSDYGITARRGQQFAGGSDSPDVIHSLDGIHFECKRVERGSVGAWLDQAIADADGKVPVVAHRSNRRPWMATLLLSDLLYLLGKTRSETS